EDAGDPQIQGGEILPSTNLGLEVLHFHDVGKVSGEALRDGVETAGVALPVVRCGTLHGFNDPGQSAFEGSERIAESHVVPFGEELPGWLVVPLHELTERQVVLLDCVV